MDLYRSRSWQRPSRRRWCCNQTGSWFLCFFLSAKHQQFKGFIVSHRFENCGNEGIDKCEQILDQAEVIQPVPHIMQADLIKFNGQSISVKDLLCQCPNSCDCFRPRVWVSNLLPRIFMQSNSSTSFLTSSRSRKRQSNSIHWRYYRSWSSWKSWFYSIHVKKAQKLLSSKMKQTNPGNHSIAFINCLADQQWTTKGDIFLELKLWQINSKFTVNPVSYTHLTLPTIYSV